MKNMKNLNKILLLVAITTSFKIVSQLRIVKNGNHLKGPKYQNQLLEKHFL